MPTDFYDVLGVDEDADAEELKRAYRDRAREYHPDLNDGDERATRMFTLVNRAHEVLSEPSERSAYDRLGHDEYVETRMNGLPSMTFESYDAGPGDAERDEVGADDATAGPADATAGPADGPSAEARRTTGPDYGSDASSTGDGPTATDAAESSTGDGPTATDAAESSTSSAAERRSTTASKTSTRADTTGATARTGSGSASGASDRRTTGPGAGSGTTSSHTGTGMGSTPAERSRPKQSARRRGLRRAYAGALVAAATYVAGLVAFALGVADAVLATGSGLAATPTATLTDASPLPQIEPYLVAAVGDLAAGTVAAGTVAALALPAGAIALPAVLLGTVARYGRGTAWAYALPSLGPLILMAGESALPAATWVDLAGFVVLPALATGAFLFDVGRYLLATR